jgi:hypothetical protein
MALDPERLTKSTENDFQKEMSLEPDGKIPENSQGVWIQSSEFWTDPCFVFCWILCDLFLGKIPKRGFQRASPASPKNSVRADACSTGCSHPLSLTVTALLS